MALMAPEIDLNAIDARIVAYENRTGIHLSRKERASLRVLASQQPTERKPQRHPLGNHADATEDQHTRENRAALKSCLAAYWDGTLAGAVNKHEDTSTGLALADRFVSLLEIGTSLQQVRLDRPELLYHGHGLPILYVELRLRDGWAVEKICQAAHIAQRTYYNIETETLHALIDSIWHDWLGPRLQAGS